MLRTYCVWTTSAPDRGEFDHANITAPDSSFNFDDAYGIAFEDTLVVRAPQTTEIKESSHHATSHGGTQKSSVNEKVVTSNQQETSTNQRRQRKPELDTRVATIGWTLESTVSWQRRRPLARSVLLGEQRDPHTERGRFRGRSGAALSRLKIATCSSLPRCLSSWPSELWAVAQCS